MIPSNEPLRSFAEQRVYQTLKLLARIILCLGFRIQIHGRQHIPRRGGFLLASNHLSYMDPVVLAVACPRYLVFVARADLFETPWLGALLRFLRAIPVHPTKPDLGLREAVRLLRHGQPIAIFPEGGRQFSGAIGTAKPGVGLLAASATVPIVPVLLQGTFEALPPTARMVRPTKIRVVFGAQIGYPKGLLPDQAYEALADQVTARWRQLARNVASQNF
jgi:1-acyl-sn-glycerol-3-phosphate acyltransferase